MLDAWRRVPSGDRQDVLPALSGLPPLVRSRSEALPREATAIDTLVEEIAELRPLPPIAAQVLQIAEDEQFSAHALAQAISSDPALTSLLLRLANSAYYGLPCRISTVRDAVVLLGFRQVWSVALAGCVMRAFRSADEVAAEPFWRHAVSVGLVTEMLGRAEGRSHQVAFTAGALHNVGRLALGQARPDALRQVITYAAHEGLSLHRAECEVLGFTDADLGGALVRHWQFPDEVALAVAGHAAEMERVFDSRSLAALVARARKTVESEGVTDGVEAPQGWAALAVAGTPVDHGAMGIDGLLPRADAFLEYSGVA